MRGLSTRPLRAAAIALGLAALFAVAARAHHYRLESTTTPAPFLRDGRADLVIEPSGVAPLGDGRRVLVAHEKAAPLHVVDVATGAIVGEPLGSPKFPPTTRTGPNWEGIARDSEENYYLVGSHGGESDEERAARSVLVRFRLRVGETPAIDDASVVRWDIAVRSRLRCGRRGSIRPGLRNGRSKVWRSARPEANASWSSASASRTTRSAPSPPTSPTRPRPTPRSSSTLCSRSTPAAATVSPRSSPRWSTSPRWAGSSSSPRRWAQTRRAMATPSGSSPTARRGRRLYATFDVGMKAGGLALLGVKQGGHRTEIKLLITYDNNPQATRMPSRFQTATLTHERN